MIGIEVNLDYLLTMFIDFYIFPILNMIGVLLAIMAYENAYTVSQDTTSSYQSTALALMTTIQSEMTSLMTF